MITEQVFVKFISVNSCKKDCNKENTFEGHMIAKFSRKTQRIVGGKVIKFGGYFIFNFIVITKTRGKE